MPGCCNQRLFDRFGAHRFNHEVDPLTARELTNSGTPLRICYVVDDLICTELPQFLRLFDAGGGRDDTAAHPFCELDSEQRHVPGSKREDRSAESSEAASSDRTPGGHASAT